MIDGGGSMIDGRWWMVDDRWWRIDGRWWMVDDRTQTSRLKLILLFLENVSNYRLFYSFHRSLVINHELSALDDLPSIIDHRPSIIEHRPSSIEHRPSIIAHPPSPTRQRIIFPTNHWPWQTFPLLAIAFTPPRGNKVLANCGFFSEFSLHIRVFMEMQTGAWGLYRPLGKARFLAELLINQYYDP